MMISAPDTLTPEQPRRTMLDLRYVVVSRINLTFIRVEEEDEGELTKQGFFRVTHVWWVCCCPTSQVLDVATPWPATIAKQAPMTKPL